MDTATLISTLRERDVRLWIEDDRLKCSAPAGALDDGMRLMLSSRKDEVIAFVRQAESLKTGLGTIIPIKPDGRRRPIFAVSGHSGDVFRMLALARHMDKDQPVLGVQPPGLDGTEPLKTVEALASYEIEQIRGYQRRGPYLIAGHCSGGTLAFEVAHQLIAAGQQIALLALIGSPFPPMFRPIPLLLYRLRKHASGLAFGSLEARKAYIVEALQRRRRSRETMLGLSPAMMAAMQRVDDAAVAAVRYYRPKFYPGELDLFVTSDWWHESQRWLAFASTSREHNVGDFEIDDVLLGPRVEVLATPLRNRLSTIPGHV